MLANADDYMKFADYSSLEDRVYLKYCPISVSKAFPVRYWVLILYTVGVPGVLSFDSSGRTHDFGLFNIQSISAIALNLTCLFLFTTVTIVSRQTMIVRPVRFGAPFWLAQLALMTATSVLQPNFRHSASHSTDLMLSFFRLEEWALAFLMFLALYSRVAIEDSIAFVGTLIARVCWTMIVLVWAVLPLAPSFDYGSAEGSYTNARLGGLLIHPTTLGVISSIACLHAVIGLRGTRRAGAVLVSLTTLALTYAREAEVVLLVSLVAYTLLFSKGAVRLFGIVFSALSVLLIALFTPALLRYAARGNGIQNILTLSDRIPVWIAAMDAIWARPWLGYGFVVGVKGALKDHWIYTHWVPPHAHNDLLQSVLSGGILAGVVLICLNVLIYSSAFRVARHRPESVLFFFVLVQLSSFSILAPLLSGQFGALSGLFLFCAVLVVDQAVGESVPWIPSSRRGLTQTSSLPVGDNQ